MNILKQSPFSSTFELSQVFDIMNMPIIIMIAIAIMIIINIDWQPQRDAFDGEQCNMLVAVVTTIYLPHHTIPHQINMNFNGLENKINRNRLHV